MKKSMIIAGVAAVALTGCCCSRNAEEVKYDYTNEVPECSYVVRNGGQVHMGEKCERKIVRQQVVQPAVKTTCAQPQPCAVKQPCAPECGFYVQKVQVAQPVVTKRKYVLVPVNY